MTVRNLREISLQFRLQSDLVVPSYWLSFLAGGNRLWCNGELSTQLLEKNKHRALTENTWYRNVNRYWCKKQVSTYSGRKYSEIHTWRVKCIPWYISVYILTINRSDGHEIYIIGVHYSTFPAPRTGTTITYYSHEQVLLTCREMYPITFKSNSLEVCL